MACCSQAQPVITQQPANQSVILGGNATFSVTVTGTGPFTYQWRLNGNNLPNNIITTVAGGQLFDGQAATNVILNSPQGAAADAAGNLFIADMNNHVVRKVDTNGVAKIVAGVGVLGFAGDNGAATNALFSQPVAVALDTNGNLFITDQGNNRVRKVDTNGTITTVAGNGGIAFGFSGAATNAGLNQPVGITLDNFGYLYIADSANQVIRLVNPSGNISSVAGNNFTFGGAGGFSGDNSLATSAKLNYPSGVTVDASGNMFIADSSNSRIRRVNTGGIITTFAGNGAFGYSGDGGSATAASLNSPNSVSVDTKSNLYVADTVNNRIRKITNNIITTVAGNGVAGFAGDGGLATNASLLFPQSVTADKKGNFFIADMANRIRKVGTNAIINTLAGKALNDGDAAVNATLNLPTGAMRDSAGNFYVADTSNHRVRKIDTNGIISTYAGNGVPTFAGDGGAATNASLYYPYGVAVDSADNLYIADQVNRRIRKVDTNGIISTVAGKGTSSFSGDGGAATNAGIFPYGIAVDAAGDLFIADPLNSRLRKVDTNGIIRTVAGNGNFSYSGDGGQATNAGGISPNGVASDSLGNLFIAGANSRIRKVNTNGIITTIGGNGTFGDSGDGGPGTNAQIKYPFGISVDPVGNVFFTDATSARIRKIGTNGMITTIAGNGVQGIAIDNLSANSTSLSLPRGVLFDQLGSLYITDTGANRFRKISYLEYANQPSFTVTNATTGLVGNNYSVVITSASGSVTSSVANINLQLPPVTPVLLANSNLISFTWNAVSNLTYQLQSATNLTAPVWQNLGSPVTATSNAVSASDVLGTDAQHFYRVHLVP